ncbi:fumarylacetoacetase [Novosphingobium chloroacetimidivorans]|uniref:fumarylacetoacetase n=1 Tax=Novosphingobium chloroacetimidivorans TaxID=1428314 RepID=A0A7W7K9F5_9SPHN|nr:fumarylacetoacetase [Novosphingobium chloroacetimidivorans]MBB4858674.1 fumarylacetoacetase [Novosphingobium chloroacetimidivorans]
MIDATHDQSAHCWVPGAADHREFPVQNLPFGLFSAGSDTPRPGTAIGDFILDLAGLAPLLGTHAAQAAAVLQPGAPLNGLLALPPQARRELRHALFALLTDDAHRDAVTPFLHPPAECRLHLPVSVRDYTDFYAGIHHARAVGALLRPENPLLPNYQYIPVGYHGRASSVRVSGHPLVRPQGQILPPGETKPVVGPSRRLDYEVELGFWIGGGSTLGTPIPIGSAGEHIAGVSLLNDWSARDLQAWEYVPLGPFLAKNFLTTVSPWIITAEALAPFRTAQPARASDDPAPLPYLLDERDQQSGAYDIGIEVALQTAQMAQAGDAPTPLGRTVATHLYWTPAQIVAHHTVNGCDLAAGDLLGSGTISTPDDDGRGSLMELSRGGRQAVTLANGETRTFLEDGDEVVMTGWAERDGYRRIGFGTCAGRVIGNPNG